MHFNIFLVKETAPGEARVALVPEDVALLVNAGHQVSVEAGAGVRAGFADAQYRKAGAEIVENHGDYLKLFKGFNLVCRAKRPDKPREMAECEGFEAGTLLVGALDPFDKDDHVAWYRKANIKPYSIDQLQLPGDHPMNILASMSAIAGRLALEDALNKTTLKPASQCLIAGTGVAGLSALEAALEKGLKIDLVSANPELEEKYRDNGQINVIFMNKALSENEQQALIKPLAKRADVVITSARSSGQRAPVLFPQSTLDEMKAGACLVDLALSEGGNVAGSHHDATIKTDNGVLITNTSGYPKIMPAVASPSWSIATRLFIEALADPRQSELLKPAYVL